MSKKNLYTRYQDSRVKDSINYTILAISMYLEGKSKEMAGVKLYHTYLMDKGKKVNEFIFDTYDIIIAVYSAMPTLLHKKGKALYSFKVAKNTTPFLQRNIIDDKDPLLLKSRLYPGSVCRPE